MFQMLSVCCDGNARVTVCFNLPLCSVWTAETVCTVLNSTITDDINCSYSCGVECWRRSKFPCLQVFVSLNASGRVALLSHNEDTQEENAEVRLDGAGETCLTAASNPPAGHSGVLHIPTFECWDTAFANLVSLFHCYVEEVHLVMHLSMWKRFIWVLPMNGNIQCPYFLTNSHMLTRTNISIGWHTQYGKPISEYVYHL